MRVKSLRWLVTLLVLWMTPAVFVVLAELLIWPGPDQPERDITIEDSEITDLRTVSVGSGHACGLRDDGTITCWGQNHHGQADAPTGTFTEVSTGRDHTCGVRNDGTVTCWGNNEYGQANVPSGVFTTISVSYDYACGLRNDGTIECWGDGSDGWAVSPVGVFTTISVSYDYACGLRNDGTIECWGKDDKLDQFSPRGVFTALSSSIFWEFFLCGLRDDGTVECWNLPRLNDDALVAVDTGPYYVYTAVSAGDYMQACGLRYDLRNYKIIECWGEDDYKHVGKPDGVFTAVSVGSGHACGLRDNGTVECWKILHVCSKEHSYRPLDCPILPIE